MDRTPGKTEEESGKASGQAVAREQQRSIDPAAPAGSPDSLGAESVRDGRPATGDDVVEAMDEVGPEIPVR